jgi:hypothetical protein
MVLLNAAAVPANCSFRQQAQWSPWTRRGRRTAPPSRPCCWWTPYHGDVSQSLSRRRPSHWTCRPWRWCRQTPAPGSVSGDRRTNPFPLVGAQAQVNGGRDGGDDADSSLAEKMQCQRECPTAKMGVRESSSCTTGTAVTQHRGPQRCRLSDSGGAAGAPSPPRSPGPPAGKYLEPTGILLVKRVTSWTPVRPMIRGPGVMPS